MIILSATTSAEYQDFRNTLYYKGSESSFMSRSAWLLWPQEHNERCWSAKGERRMNTRRSSIETALCIQRGLDRSCVSWLLQLCCIRVFYDKKKKKKKKRQRQFAKWIEINAQTQTPAGPYWLNTLYVRWRLKTSMKSTSYIILIKFTKGILFLMCIL